jgi:hypothetical protein
MDVWRGLSGRGINGRRVKKIEVHCIHTCEDSIMKFTKPCVKESGREHKEWECSEGWTFWVILYTSMQSSQWNPVYYSCVINNFKKPESEKLTKYKSIKTNHHNGRFIFTLLERDF